MYIRLKNNDKNVEMNRIMEGFGYGERRRKIDGEKKEKEKKGREGRMVRKEKNGTTLPNAEFIPSF